MEFFSLTGEEGLMLPHTKTGREADILWLKTFLYEFKQSNYQEGRYEPSSPATTDLHEQALRTTCKFLFMRTSL